MNKSELVAAVAANVGSDQAQARRHVDAVFETIMTSVVDGERVVVTGFGTFDRVTRPARTVRNPRTGRPIEVESSLAPRFSVGRTFKDTVSGVAPAGAAKPAVRPARRAAVTADVAKPSKSTKPAGKASTAPKASADGAGKKKKNGGKKAKAAKKVGRKK